MARPWMTVIGLLWLGLNAWAQVVPDSVSPPISQTVFVIPAGPVAGSFTPAARLTVNDTVAGWAHIQIEGWVPLESVLDRMKNSSPSEKSETGERNLQQNKSSGSGAVQQCAAITKSGKRCKRNAAPGSAYCWQHQR